MTKTQNPTMREMLEGNQMTEGNEMLEREPAALDILEQVRVHPKSQYIDTKYLLYRALHRHVLAVAAVCDKTGEWKCYLGPVPGHKHDEEQHQVHATGQKQPYDIASALFPVLRPLPYEY